MYHSSQNIFQYTTYYIIKVGLGRDEVQSIYYAIGGVGGVSQMLTHCDRGGGWGSRKA